MGELFSGFVARVRGPGSSRWRIGHDGGVDPHVTPVTDPLSVVALETERYVAGAGWDQPLRLFALVATADLMRAEPGLVVKPADGDQGGALSAVEQDELPDADGVEALLAGIAWPPTVVGCALALERIVVPPEAERDLPDDPAAALRQLASHPAREDVRLLVAVTRDGGARCLLRQRSHDRDDRVATGEDIAPGLVEALRATLAD